LLSFTIIGWNILKAGNRPNFTGLEHTPKHRLPIEPPERRSVEFPLKLSRIKNLALTVSKKTSGVFATAHRERTLVFYAANIGKILDNQTIIPQVSPTGRTVFAMACDVAPGQVVLFGGHDKSFRSLNF
jgi:hypothetical protein